MEVDSGDISKIKLRAGMRGLKLEFTVRIKISMHAADYIEQFDDVVNDGQLAEAVTKGLELKEECIIKIWEARYEKLN